MSASLWQQLQGWWRRSEDATGASSPPEIHDVTQSADEVEHYWTDERMRAARTRQQQLPQPDDG